MSFAFCPAAGAAKSVRYHHGTENCAIVSGPTFVICPKQLFMFVEKNTFGQVPFCSSALISVPGAPAPSLVTDSQPAVEKPGVEICAPLWVAVAQVSTFQPAVPRVVIAVDPVGGAAAALFAGFRPNWASAAVAPSATTATNSVLFFMARSWRGLSER